MGVLNATGTRDAFPVRHFDKIGAGAEIRARKWVNMADITRENIIVASYGFLLF